MPRSPFDSLWRFDLMLFDIVAKINTVDGIITPCVRSESFEHYAPFINTCKCELCNTTRRRDSLIVIRYTETKEEKVVGTGCLEKLYGHETVKKAFAEADAREAEMGLQVYNLRHYTNVCYEYIKKNGYRSASEARMTNLPSTAFQILNCTDIPFPTVDVFPKVREHYLSIVNPSDFEKNAQRVFAESEISIHGISILPALVYSFMLSEVKPSEFIGEVGKRMSGRFNFHVLSSTRNESLYSDYGVSYNNIIQLESGEILQWTTGRKVTESTMVSFFVKKQYESKRYGKVTIITRPRFE